MKPRIKVLTLGVSDLEASLAFYRDGMGLATNGIIGQEFVDGAVVFFNMTDGLILALYPTASLSRDAKITATQARLGVVSIGHIVNSKEEVDAIMKQAQQADAVITDPPHDRFWGGYSGYFHDPDGHSGRLPGIRNGALRIKRLSVRNGSWNEPAHAGERRAQASAGQRSQSAAARIR